MDASPLPTRSEFLVLNVGLETVPIPSSDPECAICCEDLDAPTEQAMANSSSRSSSLTSTLPSLAHPHVSVQIIPCGHIFGAQCLGAWLKEHDTCPMCRRILFRPSVPPPPTFQYTTPHHLQSYFPSDYHYVDGRLIPRWLPADYFGTPEEEEHGVLVAADEWRRRHRPLPFSLTRLHDRIDVMRNRWRWWVRQQARGTSWQQAPQGASPRELEVIIA